MRIRNDPKVDRICVVCGDKFLGIKARKTCSDACRCKGYRRRNLHTCRERQRQRTGAVPYVICVGLPVLRVCERCGTLFQQRKQRGKRPDGRPIEQNRFCCRECFRLHRSACADLDHRVTGGADAQAVRRRRIKANGEQDQISLPELHRRDGGVCYLCGLLVSLDLPHLHPHSGTIEHVVPVVNGGTDTWDNVRLAHRRCNNIKGTSALTVVCLDRVLDTNPFAEHLDHYALAP